MLKELAHPRRYAASLHLARDADDMRLADESLRIGRGIISIPRFRGIPPAPAGAQVPLEPFDGFELCRDDLFPEISPVHLEEESHELAIHLTTLEPGSDAPLPADGVQTTAGVGFPHFHVCQHRRSTAVEAIHELGTDPAEWRFLDESDEGLV